MDQQTTNTPPLSLEASIEALLFYKGEPESITSLAKTLNTTADEVRTALTQLSEMLQGRGLTLLFDETKAELRTAPGASALIEQIRRQELSRDLGKAGAETLAIILYDGPIARADIDYIRGVNSSFILRNLQVRGLVERTTHPTDARSYVYQPTNELLAHLGVTNKESLPDYHVVQSGLQTFTQEQETGE